jgi:hypothetical protein
MVIRGTVQFVPRPEMRKRLREFADQMQKSRVSIYKGRPVIMFTVFPEDRDLLVEALRRMAEVVDAS